MNLSTLVRRIVGVIAECNYAQRRMTILRMAPDRYLADAQAAPASYAEFLYRTSSLLPHEPRAARRAHGALVG